MKFRAGDEVHLTSYDDIYEVFGLKDDHRKLTVKYTQADLPVDHLNAGKNLVYVVGEGVTGPWAGGSLALSEKVVDFLPITNKSAKKYLQK